MSTAQYLSRTSLFSTRRCIRHHVLSLNSLPGHWRRFTKSSVHNNTQFTHDFWLTLEAFRPTEKQLGATLQLQERLQNIVQKRFGRDFDVHYVGLGSFATGLTVEKREFAIVDAKVERGEVDKVYLDNLPPAYDPTTVSQVLLEEGFNGTTEDSTLVSAAVQNHPWPTYNRAHRRELIYPVRLSGHHPVAFDLQLPGPTNMPLVRFLSAYGSVMKGVSEMISLFYLWLKSHEIDQISPVCAALLFIGFLQEDHKFPCLTSSTDTLNGQKYKTVLASRDTSRWMLHEYLLRLLQNGSEWSTEPVLLDTAFVSEPVSSKEGRFDPTNILAKFMSYSNGILQNDRGSVISVHSGIRLERQHQYVGEESVDLDLMERECMGAYSPGIQPPSWKFHPLIVQDPFVHTHNHAQFVSQTTLDSLQKQASLAQAAVASGHSLKSIFGPHIQIPEISSKIAQKRTDLISTLRKSYPPETSYSPQYSVLKARSLSINRVEDVIKKAFGSKFRVMAFGSSLFGLDCANSDLDLVVLDPDRKQGFSSKESLKKLPRVYKIKQVAGHLKHAKFEKVEPNSGAVSTVEFLDPKTGIHCDLIVNNRLGPLFSAMIKHYLDLQPISRPLMRIIKLWAKSIEMNNPSGDKVVLLDSYSLVLMTIAFFQTNGWLPNLQDLEPLSTDELSGTFWLRTRKGKPCRCDVRYLLLEWWPLVDMKLEDLLLQWFRFWGREFGYATEIVSIRHGGIVPRPARYNFKTGGKKRKNQIEMDKLDQSILADFLDPVSKADSPSAEEFDEDIDDDATEVDENRETQLSFSSPWSLKPFCVADPFNIPKNCTENIMLPTVIQFIEHCRSAEELVSRSSLQNLISDFRASTRSENGKGGQEKQQCKQEAGLMA